MVSLCSAVFLLLKPRLFPFRSVSGACVYVLLCVSVGVCACVHARVRAHAAFAVRWRLMVIAVSRLAFWVESARVGVERVARSRQRSSILCGTPRTAPCVLGANRGLRPGCSLRFSKKTRDEKLHGITFSKPSDTRTPDTQRTWSDGEREKGAFSEDGVLR